ncbi:primosomal protein N' family DNA-binding protein, partial [Rhodanobacter lindaniclasticus]
MPTVIRVALPLPLPTLFDYLPPAAAMPRPGSRVLVPFGRDKLVGVVVESGVESALDGARLKPALRALDDAPLLDAELLQTLAWATDYWLGVPGEVYTNALPLALREAKPLPAIGEEYWAITAAGREAYAAGRRRGGSRSLLALLAGGALGAPELNERQSGWREAARRLAAAGLLERREQAPPGRRQAVSMAPALSDEQRRAVATVAAGLGRYQPFLLDGVTGSGKTEVYLALIEQVLAQGRQALLLVPEIGLALQTVRRLRERLGVSVEVLHSNLSEGDRARAWLRARAGTARVILGTRSAIFTP